MGRDSYSVIVERPAFDHEPSIEISIGRVPTPRTVVAPAPRESLPAEIDAAFQPWIANVTPLPVRRPKATPAPKLSFVEDVPTIADCRPPAPSTAGARPQSSAPPHGGAVLTTDGLIDGKYRVEAVLGAGGMGVVVAASHVHLGTTVAIKTLRPEAAVQPEMARRFLREARAASRLRSDHVCRALDVGQMPSGEPYIVMEMLHGRDLASQVQAQGPLSVADAATYVLQACEAVAEAHALGMVHRDLKPANLMLTRRSDGSPHVKVLDFGIATSATGDVDSGLTRSDVAMGSPGYMSPEQLRSAKSVDARSDIWSLGVTLYELVSGMVPFCGDSVSSIAIAVVTEEPAPLTGVPAGFAAVVARCLRKTPSERYASIAELAAALAPFVHDGAVRAARIASSVQAFVPPTLMGEVGLAAQLAPTMAPRARTDAPAYAQWTSFSAAPVFTPSAVETTQRIVRASRVRLSALLGMVAAVAAVATAALALM